MRLALLLIASCALSISASAQVHRCIDAAGKVSFSDVICPSNQKGARIQDAPDPRAVEAERVQAYQARQEFQERQAAEAATGAARQATGTGTGVSNGGTPRTASNTQDCAIAQKNAWGNQTGAMQSKARAACLSAAIAAQGNTRRAAPALQVEQPAPSAPVIQGARGTSYTRIGSTTFGSDGTTTTQIGNSTFRSNGVSSTRIGNSTFDSNGQTHQQIGGTTFHSNGTTTQRIGNATFRSDGTVCQPIGATTFCN